MTAVPVKGALVIDGRVSDAAWSRAVPVMSLYQRETFEGLPATEPTHVGSFRRHEPLYRRSGSDFFVVYNELDEWGQMFGVRNRSLSVKLNYLFAF